MLAGLHAVPHPSLSLRAETAVLRPFLYTHRNSTTAYLHYLDPLGHPAGPNAVDYALFVDWQPTPRWHAALHAAFTLRGRNSVRNAGADPRIGFSTPGDYPAPLLGGIRQNLFLLEAYAGYELLPRLYLEAAVRARHVEDAGERDMTAIEPFLSMRWGLPFGSLRY